MFKYKDKQTYSWTYKSKFCRFGFFSELFDFWRCERFWFTCIYSRLYLQSSGRFSVSVII